MKKRRQKHTNVSSKKLWAAVVVLVLAGVLIYWLWPNSKPVSTPSKSAGAQGTPSKPVPHTQPPSTQNSVPGEVKDNQGQTNNTPPPSSQWSTSSSEVITLQQPTAGQTLRSGDTISGLAKVSTVQFILKDNSVGLIGQGTLNVVNGKFAGTMNFTAHSSSGQLEAYYPNPSTGAEEDVITINVNFGT